ncbi:MAG TPA: thioredoxin family protein [Candidatus Krumholzibacteria bacterium]
MSLTASTMLPLGTPAPNFDLPDPSGRHDRLSDFADRRLLLVMFICNHCPFVQHIREALANFAREYQEQGVGIVAINSNDIVTHPQDAPHRMAAEAERFGYGFPYLFDESQEVAKSYMAACTPDFFLFDKSRQLVYRGQFDGSRPDNGTPTTGCDLRSAVDQLFAGETVGVDQTPSIGCNIKWKAGNEPDYISLTQRPARS